MHTTKSLLAKVLLFLQRWVFSTHHYTQKYLIISLQITNNTAFNNMCFSHTFLCARCNRSGHNNFSPHRAETFPVIFRAIASPAKTESRANVTQFVHQMSEILSDFLRAIADGFGMHLSQHVMMDYFANNTRWNVFYDGSLVLLVKP